MSKKIKAEDYSKWDKNLYKENKTISPLEALKEVREHLYGDVYAGVEKRLDIVETALERLESYEKNEDFIKDVLACDYLSEEEKIKKLKALEIIKEKRVDVFGLICCMQLNEYTALETYNLKENCHNSFLTQAEFNLLKEVLL